MSVPVHTNDSPEFLGQIIDIFEDFLDDRNVRLDNPEKTYSDDDIAIIYGTDYGDLQNRLGEMMTHWGIIAKF